VPNQRERVGEFWSAVELHGNEVANSARYLKPIRHPRLTTELKILTPRVDLAREAGLLGAESSNAWSSVAAPRVVVDPQIAAVPSTAEVPDPQLLKHSVFLQVGTGGDLIQDLVMAVSDDKAAQEQDLSPLVELSGVELADNAMHSVPFWMWNTVIGEQAAASPSRVGILWEDVSALAQTARAQLNEELKQRQAQARAFLHQVQRSIDAALLPPPAYAPGAVRVRGAVRTSGQPRQERVRAVVLGDDWTPRRTLQLALSQGPVVQANRLLVDLDVDDPTLVGRQADLVLTSGEAEVALVSAHIEPAQASSAACILFRLDLSEAQLETEDGMLHSGALHVVIEPPEANSASGERVVPPEVRSSSEDAGTGSSHG